MREKLFRDVERFQRGKKKSFKKQVERKMKVMEEQKRKKMAPMLETKKN